MAQKRAGKMGVAQPSPRRKDETLVPFPNRAFWFGGDAERATTQKERKALIQYHIEHSTVTVTRADGTTRPALPFPETFAGFCTQTGSSKVRGYYDEDGTIVGGATEPRTYWRKLISYFPPGRHTSLRAVLKHLAEIQPHQQPANSALYTSVKMKLETVLKDASFRGWKEDGPKIYNWPTVEELEALRIYGDASRGFGVLPEKIFDLLRDTALVFLLIPPDQRVIPTFWKRQADYLGLQYKDAVPDLTIPQKTQQPQPSQKPPPSIPQKEDAPATAALTDRLAAMERDLMRLGNRIGTTESGQEREQASSAAVQKMKTQLDALQPLTPKVEKMERDLESMKLKVDLMWEAFQEDSLRRGLDTLVREVLAEHTARLEGICTAIGNFEPVFDMDRGETISMVLGRTLMIQNFLRKSLPRDLVWEPSQTDHQVYQEAGGNLEPHRMARLIKEEREIKGVTRERMTVSQAPMSPFGAAEPSDHPGLTGQGSAPAQNQQEEEIGRKGKSVRFAEEPRQEGAHQSHGAHDEDWEAPALQRAHLEEGKANPSPKAAVGSQAKTGGWTIPPPVMETVVPPYKMARSWAPGGALETAFGIYDPGADRMVPARQNTELREVFEKPHTQSEAEPPTRKGGKSSSTVEPRLRDVPKSSGKPKGKLTRAGKVGDPTGRQNLEENLRQDTSTAEVVPPVEDSSSSEQSSQDASSIPGEVISIESSSEDEQGILGGEPAVPANNNQAPREDEEGLFYEVGPKQTETMEPTKAQDESSGKPAGTGPTDQQDPGRKSSGEDPSDGKDQPLRSEAGGVGSFMAHSRRVSSSGRRRQREKQTSQKRSRPETSEIARAGGRERAASEEASSEEQGFELIDREAVEERPDDPPKRTAESEGEGFATVDATTGEGVSQKRKNPIPGKEHNTRSAKRPKTGAEQPAPIKEKAAPETPSVKPRAKRGAKPRGSRS
ncbi:uncharacterized protein JN550_004210 [Neoarthrinium moseri]|uniref:uncharacterized protein n=1 Tax=Neoarthrinium moseri TaxID=1658444 RepID=UPI001FDC25BD|nr:uncharacterized protein JN550_004210 [Neoarthrinium moseri]KAI1872007.1 hypothetical protein JN550_004210 [Neoarthrinium moseri]